jgi:tetratricopeptide (TPR) repeat protein
MRTPNTALKKLALLPLLLAGLGGCVTNEAATWFKKGVEVSDGDKKIAYFTKAAELNHQMASAFNGSAMAYNDLGSADKAIADQKVAKAFDREQSAALVNRGIAFKIKGQYDRAIQDYDEAIHFTPEMAQAYGIRGNAYSLKDLHDKAINDETRSIALAKASGDDRSLILGYLNRAHAHQSKGSYNLTLRDVGKVLKIFPNNAHARAHLAWVRATAPDAVFRDEKLAVEDAEKAAGLERNAFNLDVLAAAYAEAGQFDKAIEALSQVKELLQTRGGEGSLAEFENI